MKKKLDGNYTRMLWAILNKSRRQHPTKQSLYGHLPPIMKTINVKRTRHAGHCWRSKDEFISDILLWSPSHRRAMAGRPDWTYLQQLCADTGYSLKDVPGAMDDRNGMRQRVREIRAGSVTWWWWWWYVCVRACARVYVCMRSFFHLSLSLYIYIYIQTQTHRRAYWHTHTHENCVHSNLRMNFYLSVALKIPCFFSLVIIKALHCLTHTHTHTHTNCWKHSCLHLDIYISSCFSFDLCFFYSGIFRTLSSQNTHTHSLRERERERERESGGMHTYTFLLAHTHTN